MVRKKKWWRSRTLWFNAFMAAAAAAEAGLGILQPVLGASSYPTIAFTLAVGNALLRVVTTHAVEK